MLDPIARMNAEAAEIVTSGRVNEVMDGVALRPQWLVTQYWRDMRKCVAADGGCGECDSGYRYVNSSGEKFCPHTGEVCFCSLVDLLREMV